MSAVVKNVHGRCHSIIASTFGKEKKIFICNPQRPGPMLPGPPPKVRRRRLGKQYLNERLMGA